MRLSLNIMLLNGTKVGKRLPTHRTHMWRKSRSPSTVSKSPPLPLKGSPFPSQNTLPLPPPPFSYKSLLLSRERKATGIYIIKISLDIQRSLRGFSNRFKISVLGGLLYCNTSTLKLLTSWKWWYSIFEARRLSHHYSIFLVLQSKTL